MERGEKQKQYSVSVLQNADRQHPPQTASDPTKLLPWELPAESQHQVAIPLNSICEHLCFTLIYSVYPLAK